MKEREERIRKAKEDPILVYRIPGEDGLYAIVKSWGEDFTPLRRLYGMLTHPKIVKLFTFWTPYLVLNYLLIYKFAYQYGSGFWAIGDISKNAYGLLCASFWIIVLLINLLWTSKDSLKFFETIRNTVKKHRYDK